MKKAKEISYSNGAIYHNGNVNTSVIYLFNHPYSLISRSQITETPFSSSCKKGWSHLFLIYCIFHIQYVLWTILSSTSRILINIIPYCYFLFQITFFSHLNYCNNQVTFYLASTHFILKPKARVISILVNILGFSLSDDVWSQTKNYAKFL